MNDLQRIAEQENESLGWMIVCFLLTAIMVLELWVLETWFLFHPGGV